MPFSEMSCCGQRSISAHLEDIDNDTIRRKSVALGPFGIVWGHSRSSAVLGLPCSRVHMIAVVLDIGARQHDAGSVI